MLVWRNGWYSESKTFVPMRKDFVTGRFLVPCTVWGGVQVMVIAAVIDDLSEIKVKINKSERNKFYANRSKT